LVAGFLSGAPIASQAGEQAALNADIDTWSLSYLSAPDNLQSEATSPILDYFAHWSDRVDQAQASQPHWITPLATTTPRLEQEYRYDQLDDHLGNGANLDNFGNGKGLELIPTTTNEIILGVPGYIVRTDVEAAHGLADWPFLLVKQRLVSANEENGNYIVTVFLAGQAPTGAEPFTNHSYVITPTLAAGKGWGNFDIQATVGVPVPVEHENEIGTTLVSNVALQYHFLKYFWPEFEFNDTYWFDGPRARAGINQLFVTPGIIFGRFQISQRVKLIFGVGYQFAVLPSQQILHPLTPTFDHGVLWTARVTF
jgi:hypothetical protein